MLAVYFKSLPKKEGTIMSTMQTKSLNTPEEIRTLPKTTVEVITFGELSLMKLTFQPGWRWSEHVKPAAGTESCEVPHFNYGISGRLHVRMDDGTESEIGPGDAQLLPPGHDAWVVGDEPYVGLDFQGGHLYGKSHQ
jgi:quercetin dioxygenase-like cupin family protein